MCLTAEQKSVFANLDLGLVSFESKRSILTSNTNKLKTNAQPTAKVYGLPRSTKKNYGSSMGSVNVPMAFPLGVGLGGLRAP